MQTVGDIVIKRSITRTCRHSRVDSTVLHKRGNPTRAVWCVDCKHAWLELAEQWSTRK